MIYYNNVQFAQVQLDDLLCPDLCNPKNEIESILNYNQIRKYNLNVYVDLI